MNNALTKDKQFYAVNYKNTKIKIGGDNAVWVEDIRLAVEQHMDFLGNLWEMKLNESERLMLDGIICSMQECFPAMIQEEEK